MQTAQTYWHRVDVDESNLGGVEVHVAVGSRSVEGGLDELGEVGRDLCGRHGIGWCCHGAN
jgi:hypothetical protein